ncbi:unnamed protein product [Nesidiocoris tenuis]|uniref:Uncharacterized protein n=1 Tax=Nesidiocoris tenuis TaxID=355587 RepID=A0A6H5GCV0_9HEMI|nr:unnamed protein product [Nesidiocoris tenuis]
MVVHRVPDKRESISSHLEGLGSSKALSSKRFSNTQKRQRREDNSKTTKGKRSNLRASELIKRLRKTRKNGRRAPIREKYRSVLYICHPRCHFSALDTIRVSLRKRSDGKTERWQTRTYPREIFIRAISLPSAMPFFRSRYDPCFIENKAVTENWKDGRRAPIREKYPSVL